VLIQSPRQKPTSTAQQACRPSVTKLPLLAQKR
jgi:hypothetical protein